MRVNRLYTDTRPNEQPLGTYPYGKNGVVNDLNGSIFNEPGFSIMAAVVPYQLMGIIPTDANPVLFSTNNLNSAIGYFDPATETYIPIVDDATWSLGAAKLGFNVNYYITGQAQRNYKGEQVVAFTDKNAYPKCLNCDNPALNTIDDIRLFARAQDPLIILTQTVGGTVVTGTYYVAINYERKDGTTAPYSEVSNGLTIGQGTIVGVANQAILITITNLDTSYDYIRVSIISRINNLINVLQFSDTLTITSSGIVETLFTGDNIGETIDIREVLTPPAIYDRINTIGQLNDALYIGGVHVEPDINDMQQYANLVQLKWQSQLATAIAPPPNQVNGSIRSFMHEEVYAYYIRYHKILGGFTKAFIIPGEIPLTADLVNSTETGPAGMANAPKFKVEDTIHSFDTGSFTGTCGIWQNTNELYPDTIDFDSTALGGINLRGQKVLHHKMPTLRWCKANLYSGDDDYGRTKLDLLGIIADNVTIPAKYIDIIDGYEILYAERTTSNMVVYGQGMLMHGVCIPADVSKPVGEASIYTTGMNLGSGLWENGSGITSSQQITNVRKDTMRFHAFDILLNKPSIAPDAISSQFLLTSDTIQADYLEDAWDGTNNSGPNLPEIFLADYTKSGIAPVGPSTGTYLKALKSAFYLPNNLSFNKFINTRHESCFAGELDMTTPWAYPQSIGQIPLRISGHSNTESGLISVHEQVYMVNLVAVKVDLYTSFTEQTLVSAGNYKLLADNTPYFGGDSYICDYTYHTYGRHDALDGYGSGYKGKKCIRRFVCESASNINLRYSTGTIYSQWYPVSAVAVNDPPDCYPEYMDRSIDPNQFGYTKDLNALNNFISSTIFNPLNEVISDFPYRIHRGGKLPAQAKPRNWKTFLALDYYDCQKNMGKIINLHGMDDRLIIHHENALFRTQDKAKLESGILSITLGAGDIFQFEPQQAVSAKLGYAGTIHDLACTECPFGYAFVDAKQGEIFLLKAGLDNIGEGISVFLRQYAKMTDNNPYNGNGISIGYDQKYKRILVTFKNFVYEPIGTTVVSTQNPGSTFEVVLGGSPSPGDIINIPISFANGDAASFILKVQNGWVISDILTALAILINANPLFKATLGPIDGVPGISITNKVATAIISADIFITNNTIIDQGTSFTLSYSVLGKSWTFFHDYIPDMYITTRSRLFSANNNSLYEHNTGLPGDYYGRTYPFFIDIVFHDKVSTGGINNTFIPTYIELLLSNINWATEYFINGLDQVFKTLSYITVWNSTQHSGKIDVRGDTTLISTSTRKTRGQWVFNNFRNILLNKIQPFLQDQFHDYLLQDGVSDPNMPWHKKEILQDTWFCVRFEFDNSEVANIILHDAGIDADKTKR